MSSTSLTLQIGGDISRLRAEMLKATGLMNSFSSQLKGIASQMGLTFGAVGIFQGLRYGVKTIGDFTHAMQEVRAITNATDKDFQALEKNALELGRTTKFTAKEVAELQIAFGRLGFSTTEILNATGATLQLASATGEDLAKSADIAGSTLRSFNLDAREMQRVVDVMAASFNKSALGLDNFGEAMKYVAPVAAAANISIEETTAMLGVLADAGIRGSMAGTSLRKIISDVGGETGTLSEKLKKLAEKGLTGADAMDEVGRTAYASLLILAKHTEKVDEATVAYQNATGEAKKMSDLMEDDLWGDVKKLESAMDGFILKFTDAAGGVRELTQSLTELLAWMSQDSVVTFLKKWFELATTVPRMVLDLPKIVGAHFGGDDKGMQTPGQFNPLFSQFSNNASKPGAGFGIFPVGGQLGAPIVKAGEQTKKVLQEVIQLSQTAQRAVTGALMGGVTDKDGLGIIPVDTKAMFERMESLRVKNEETTQSIAENWLDLSGTISNALATVAEGLGQSIMGVGDFGETIIRALAGFARQIGEMLIGIGVGMLAAKMAIKNPFTAIAAGVALVALSGMMSAGMSQAQGNFNSVGGGGAGRTAEMSVNVGGVIKGNDLHIMNRRTEYRKSWTG